MERKKMPAWMPWITEVLISWKTNFLQKPPKKRSAGRFHPALPAFTLPQVIA